VQAPGAAQRRPAPKRSGTSLLDDILGKTAKLHSSVRNTRVGDDANDVATPYMMSKSASASSSLLVCRMPECTPPNTAAIFDIDMRHGDRVCVRCGTVQNSRSIESQEEEHRTFADDDKAESKKRTEINDGKQGGRTGDTSLRTANALANAETGKDDKKLDAWKNKVKDVATKMNLNSATKDSAFNFCTMFSDSQKLHDELCKDPNCRLRKGVLRKKDDLVAASVLMYALREQGFARQFQTFAAHLRIDNEAMFRSEVGQVFDLVKAHLKQFEAKNYTCVTGDNSVVCADDDDKVEQALVQITSLFPEFCGQLHLPYMVQRRAEDIYVGWYKHGTRTALPQTIAAAAILSASKETAVHLQETMGIELKMEDLTRVAGLAEGTIMKFLKEVPPPIGRSDAAAAPASQQINVKTER
jgi:transcription initiation factor TFIIIB Brf1 subunit/transcription initiation factor TFIIB